MADYNYIFTNTIGAIKITGSGKFNSSNDPSGIGIRNIQDNFDMKACLVNEVAYKYINKKTILIDEEGVSKLNSEIIFIDYLGLLKSQNNGSQYEKITEISMSLKRAAMQLKKPLFVLHQLSRDLKERKDKRPLLSDLRGSGQLEQDADMVLFVHRPAYYDLSLDKSELEIIVAKNRHGESAKILPFAYYAGSQKIAERGVVTWNK